MMDLSTFERSLQAARPPAGLGKVLLALWHDGKGDWHSSHEIAQDLETSEGAWIHAYLHRKEGDLWNADYWYRRAGKSRPAFSLETEWEALVQEFLLNA